MRVYLIAVVFAILSITVAVSALITFILNRFVSLSVTVPSFVWMLVLSVVLGTALTTLLSKWILAPITKLSKAMSSVTSGDFTVHLESRSRIREIRETYQNFSLMVRELRTTETLQSDFVTNVSHEIKTPVNAIEGYATLLQDHPQQPEEQAEYVDKILYNTKRLSQLVSNILLLSKVENQSIRVEKQQYRLDEQIRQAILTLEPKWTEKEIDFDVDMEQVAWRGNEGLLLHVWTNLIDNAVKFNPYGGIVRIRLKRTENRIEFTIEDNGPGIAEAEQKHIYDKFYQSDGSHKSEGNGLGLALVKRILDTCGGRIVVRSNEECGSRFTVTLPANE